MQFCPQLHLWNEPSIPVTLGKSQRINYIKSGDCEGVEGGLCSCRSGDSFAQFFLDSQQKARIGNWPNMVICSIQFRTVPFFRPNPHRTRNATRANSNANPLMLLACSVDTPHSHQQVPFAGVALRVPSCVLCGLGLTNCLLLKCACASFLPSRASACETLMSADRRH